MGKVLAAKDLNDSITLESIRSQHPDDHNIKLNFQECCAISDESTFSHIPLSRVWVRQIDFAEELGFEAQAKTKDIFYSVIVDAILAHDIGTCVHYSRSKSSNQACFGMGHDRLMTVLKFLTDNELIVNFIVSPNSNNSLRSFFAATPKLVEACGAQVRSAQQKLDPRLWSTFCTYRKYYPCMSGQIIMRKYRAKLDVPELSQSNQDMIEQNIFLQDSNIGFSPPQERIISSEGPYIKFETNKSSIVTLNTEKVLQKRIFVKENRYARDCFGGRIYCAFWQRICEEDRTFITFDGEAAGKEVDFKSLHADISYTLVSAEMPDNPYDAECKALGIFTDTQKRNVCKVALLIAFNAQTLISADGALASYLVDTYPALYGFQKRPKEKLSRTLSPIQRKPVCLAAKEIVAAVIAHNRPIEDYICADMGIRFQRIDSEIMMATQNRCRAENIPVLGVHDSVLSPQSKSQRVKKIFYEELDIAKTRLRNDGLCSYDNDCSNNLT